MKAPLTHLDEALKTIRKDGQMAAERIARYPEDLELFAPSPRLTEALSALCEALGQEPISPSTYAFAAYYSKLR